MATGSVFINNLIQSVRLPAEARFPETVKNVTVRVVDQDLILSPIENTWDSFFLSESRVTDDFMAERTSQDPQARESF